MKTMTLQRNVTPSAIFFQIEENEEPCLVTDEFYRETTNRDASRFIPIPSESSPSCEKVTQTKPIPLPIPNNSSDMEDEVMARERLKEMYDMATWQMYIR